jgi:hypothetical protein
MMRLLVDQTSVVEVQEARQYAIQMDNAIVALIEMMTAA